MRAIGRFYISGLESSFTVIVSDNICEERQRYTPVFGPPPDGEAYNALCSNTGNDRRTFALFFDYKTVSREIIAHECFHLTHRMFQAAGRKFDVDSDSSHEPWAYLNGGLYSIVSDFVGQALAAKQTGNGDEPARDKAKAQGCVC